MSQEAARKLSDDELLHHAALARNEMRDAQVDDDTRALTKAWQWSNAINVVADERGLTDWKDKVEAKAESMRGGWFNVPRE